MELALVNLPLALGAGMVTVLSPCSYPFWGVILAYYMQDSHSRLRWLAGGSWMVLGFLLFAGSFGVATYFLLSSFLWLALYFEGLAASLLIFFGVATLANWHLPFYVPTVAVSTGQGYRTLFTLGISYGASAIGCTVWPFLGVLFAATLTRDATASTIIYGTYVATVAAPIFIMSAVAAQVRELSLERVANQRLWIRRVTGLLLIGAGLYLLRFFVWEEIVARF